MTWEKVWRWGPAILCAAAIFTLSSMPKLPEPPGILGELTKFDKVNHTIAYIVLGALVLRSLAWSQQITRAIAAKAWLITAIYGATDEIHQSFVPGRYCDIMDWVADAAGAAIGITAMIVYHRYKGGSHNERRKGL